MIRRQPLLKRWFSIATRWAKKNVELWTLIVIASTILIFLFGPFVQSEISTRLSHLFKKRDVVIEVCSPLRSATLLVTSSSENNQKIHSANQFPLFNPNFVVIHNASETPISLTKIAIRPINHSRNEVIHAEMYTDNYLSEGEFKVTHDENGAFFASLGTMIPKQTLVFQSLTFWPTAYLVEFQGGAVGSRSFNDAGACNLASTPDKLTLPNDFYKFDLPENFSTDEKPNFKVDDIKDPIGPLNWQVRLQYDCGNGIEEQTVSLGEPLTYCNVHLNSGEKPVR